MPKLNQVVAVVSGQKTEAEKALTEAYHAFQKGELFAGLARTYTPKNEADTDRKPPERKHPQTSVRDLYGKAMAVLAKTIDSVATQDWGNCGAKADVVVDGAPVLKGVPVTHLLFLEHKLVDLHTFVSKMPIRDAAESWQAADTMYITDPIRTEVTKKMQVPIVKYDATKEHPAQTELITKDEVVGWWDTRKFSTAVSGRERDEMLGRIVKLQEAVKEAREEANSIVVEKREVAGSLLGYVFGSTLGTA